MAVPAALRSVGGRTVTEATLQSLVVVGVAVHVAVEGAVVGIAVQVAVPGAMVEVAVGVAVQVAVVQVAVKVSVVAAGVQVTVQIAVAGSDVAVAVAVAVVVAGRRGDARHRHQDGGEHKDFLHGTFLLGGWWSGGSSLGLRRVLLENRTLAGA